MIRRLLWATGFSGLGRFFSTLGNMLFVLAVSQDLDAAALGIYGLLFFFIQLFSGIAPLGYPMYLAREVAHLRDDDHRLGISLSEGLSGLLRGSALSLIIWVGLALFYDKLSLELLALAVLGGVLWGIEYILSGLLIGFERLAENAVWHGISLGVIIYFLFFQAFVPLSLPTLLWLRVAATLVGLVGRLWGMRGLRRLIKFTIRLHSYKETAFFWYSGWVFMASRQIDVLVLSFFLPDEALGGYFLALRIFLTFGIIAEVIGVALTPFISRAYHGREERSLNWLLHRVLLAIFILGIPLGAVFHYGRDWLVAFFNRQLVSQVSPLLAVLSWVVPFAFGNHLLGAFLSASNYQRERFFIHLWVVFLLFSAMIPGVSIWGVMGAVWVKMISELLLFLILLWRITIRFGYTKKTIPTGVLGGKGS